MRERRGDTPDFLLKKDAHFWDLRGMLECTLMNLLVMLTLSCSQYTFELLCHCNGFSVDLKLPRMWLG